MNTQALEPCLQRFSGTGSGRCWGDWTPGPRLTFVIFPPLKLAKRLSERVKTLDVLWMVKRLLAGTFFLHL